MASSRNLVHALALLIATGLLTAVPAHSAQQNLIEASAAGNLARVKALLAAKADVNARNAEGGTALMIASQNHHLEVVRAMLAAKADVNAKRADGVTALMFASQNGQLEVVRALLTAKADVNAEATNGGTALMGASLNGQLEVVQALLAAKADVNAKAASDATALMVASERGHVDVVRALLAANADVNAKAADGLTAEEIAARNGHPQVVQASKAPPLPPPDRMLKEAGLRTGNAANPQPSIPAWIVQGGKIYVASKLDEDMNPPEVDKTAFTWNMVHPLKKGSLAFMERGEKGQNIAWSVSTYPFDVGSNRVSYPIEAIVPPYSDGAGHLMLAGIFKAKIDIKAGDTLRIDGYEIRAGRTVRAGDSIPVLSWGAPSTCPLKPLMTVSRGLLLLETRQTQAIALLL